MSIDNQTAEFDAIIVGAGTSGMTAAHFATQRGAKVLVIDHAPLIGGTLHYSSGQMSGSGTKLQAEQGIEDNPDIHFEDALRITRGKGNHDFMRKVMSLQGGVVDWLMDEGFEMQPNMPMIWHGHEAYKTARTYQGVDDGRSVLKVLTRLFEAAIEAGQVTLKLETGLESLIRDETGAVVGITMSDGTSATARAVALCAGGYAANTAFFEKVHNGSKLYSGAWEYCDGSAAQVALAEGAQLRGAEDYLPTFGGYLNHTHTPPRYNATGGYTPQSRQPWEIYVSPEGNRFMQEDNPSVDYREHQLLAQTDERAWVVFDQHIMDTAPQLIGEWSRETWLEAFEANPNFHKAQSLAEMEQKLGMPAGNLEATVTRYNSQVEAGSDADFDRTHLPARIETGPFYALEMVGMSVKSYAGLVVDLDMRVLDAKGAAIPGLLAAGEILGGSIYSGNSFLGGMSITPALAWGKYIGEHMLPAGDVQPAGASADLAETIAQ